MADTGDSNKPRKLQLTKTVEAGKVQQNFSRGRSKTVTVEVKKTRTFTRSEGNLAEDNQDSKLTEDERQARLRAIESAKTQDRTTLPPKPKQEMPKPKKEVQAGEEPDEGAEKPKASDSSAPAAAVDAPPAPDADKSFKKKAPTPAAKEKEAPKEQKPKFREEKRKNKLTIANAMDQEERMRSLSSIKRARQKAKRTEDDGPKEKTTREVTVPETITVQELANRMAERVADVIKELMKLGVMATGPQVIDADTAELVINEFGHSIKRVTDADVEDILGDETIPEKDLAPRPPVVTVMGHVDHGKTSLLDAIRSTNVTKGEAGGITQHIGAYQVKTKDGQLVSFIDTPGHAAFTQMRARGAQVTDIVILVVAADDGIMPQTIEAINHAKAAEVPIIVAINKMDKPEANPDRVKNELLGHELIPEDMGGDIMCVPVSATEGTGLDTLLESVLLQSEVLELKASPKARTQGTVLEARVDKGRGIVATLLVQGGTLNKGDIVLAGIGMGKIKAMMDDKGKQLKDAPPSMPVEVLGLSETPSAGDMFYVVEQEKQARDIAGYRIKKQRDLQAAENATPTGEGNALDKLFQNVHGASKTLPVIIKGDVQGSIEAIIGSLEKLNNDEITVKIVHNGAGGITESDVTLASAVGAIILGFNVRANAQARQHAEEEKVDIRYYSVIYDLIDDAKQLVGGMMKPVIREEFIGTAEILEVFKITKAGKVAGCVVKDGVVKRGAGVRLLRDDVVIHEGKLKTLKRFKDEVDEVKQGTECGMAFENYEDIKAGDMIEAFEVIEEQAKIE